jgi:hypothetical protein
MILEADPGPHDAVRRHVQERSGSPQPHIEVYNEIK